MMKVIQINATYGVGSTGLIVQDISGVLLEMKDQSGVAYQLCTEAPTNGFRIGNWFDWKTHGLLTRITGRQAYCSATATKKLLKWMDKQEPDVVHLHNLHSNYINLNILLAYLARNNIATVITLHDCWFFTGKCFHFAACGCEKWRSGCGNCPQNKSDVRSVLFDRSAEVFRDKLNAFQAIPNLTVVGCSDWITKLAELSPVFRGKKLLRIYNGVDTDVFCEKDRESIRQTNGLKGKFVILGMANKWLQPRNESIFNAVVSNLGLDEMLILVGCSDSQKAMLGRNEKIMAIGFIHDRRHLADVYQMSDVFVNLTYEDTLPTVNMESLCCGTPVITFDSCGSPELVQDGVTGYVVPQGDESELYTKIMMVKKNMIDRASCAEIGKRIFDKKKQYEKYYSLYHSLLNNVGR